MSYVYAITDGTHVKVGTSRDPIRRMRDMQTSHAQPLTLEWVGAGGTDVERAMHAFLAPRHVRGEWFDLVPDIENPETIADTIGEWMQTVWAIVTGRMGR